MLGRKLFIVLTVAVSGADIIGCGGEAARSAQRAQPQIGSAAAASALAARSSAIAPNARPLRADPSRETFLTTYNNPEMGISFRYPRNYSLEEGDVQERSFFLQRQEDLDSEQPGAELLATVLIPEDGYPNTTFEHGSLQLAINDVGTEKACHDVSDAETTGNVSGKATVQGVLFHWSEQLTETAGTKMLQRKYAGYSQGTCYEFLLTLAAEEAPDPDGFQKPADLAKIMRKLERVVASTQIFSKSTPPLTEIKEETADRL